MKLPLVQNFLAIAVAAVIGGVAVALIKHKSSASSPSHDASAVGQMP
jgi:AAHS family benzoate transporter-like MFS transporter